jgi:hypothetical protein
MDYFVEFCREQERVKVLVEEIETLQDALDVD